MKVTGTMLEALVSAVAAAEGHHKIETTTEFSRETRKIIIPEGMTKKQAADDLMLQHNNEEQKQDFVHELSGWDWKDGLRAFRNVLEDQFGYIKGVTTMFSTPTEIDIVTDITDGGKTTEKAFIGKVAFPAWEDAKGQVGVGANGVYIQINAKRKFGNVISKFFNDVRNYLETQSIYRGKAVLVSKVPIPGGQHQLNMDIIEVKPNDRIFLNENEELSVNDFVIGDLGEPGKRVYLFTGVYGNGGLKYYIIIF